MGVTSPATAWKEARRFRALELSQEGWSQRDIAEALGVSEGAVSQWMHAAALQGPAALAARPRSGAPPRLAAVEYRHLLALLAQGAEAFGFRGQVWTCDRVARVIVREFGVRYHKAHVSRILKMWKWTPQLPRQKAAQRDEEEIRHWREETWPRLKRGR